MSQGFSRFLSLPPELRHLVYSRMELSERIRVARTSQDAGHYLKQHTVKVTRAALFVDPKVPSLNIKLDHYEERHRLSAEMIDTLRVELNSYVNCDCNKCQMRVQWKRMNVRNPSTTVVEMDWESIDNVFYITQFVNIHYLSVTTNPYGGLVDTLQPPRTIDLKLDLIGFVWHKRMINNGQERELDLPKWSTWIEFFGAPSLQMVPIDCRVESIDREIFDCPAVQNAESVTATHATMSMNQIRQLKGSSLDIPKISSSCITQSEYVQFFRDKLLEWIEEPRMMYYHIRLYNEGGGEGGEFLPPHNCLVEVLGEILHNGVDLRADFRVYDNWDSFNRAPGHAITIRHLPTNRALLITECSLTCYRDELRQSRWPYP